MTRSTSTPGAVCMPAQEFMPTLATQALVSLMQAAPKGTVFLPNVAGCTLARKRNQLVAEFLEHRELQWLLFVDSDMTPPGDTIARLLAWDVDVVGALYFTKHSFTTCARLEQATDLGEADPLKRAEEIGTGCLMVRRRVFTDLVPSPWFEIEGFDREGGNEDGVFSKKLRDAGVPIHCDTGLVAGHLTMTPVDLNHIIERCYLRAHALLDPELAKDFKEGIRQDILQRVWGKSVE